MHAPAAAIEPTPLLVIELAGEPKGKGRPKFRHIRTNDGRELNIAYTDAATRSYEGMLRYAAQQQMRDRPPVATAVRVAITAVFSIPRSWSKHKQAAAAHGFLRPACHPDWDNVAKVIDALNGVVWNDDRQIVSCLVEKHYGARPYYRVEIWEERGPML